MRLAAFVLFCVMLGGCGAGDLKPSQAARTLLDYETVVAQAPLVTTLRAKGKTVQIAKPKPSIGSQPGDWTVCLESTEAKKAPEYYAVFLSDKKAIDSRLAVIIDGCESETYTLLPK